MVHEYELRYHQVLVNTFFLQIEARKIKCLDRFGIIWICFNSVLPYRVWCDRKLIDPHSLLDPV